MGGGQIGQVGFIIKYQNTYTMIDGYLSDYVDKNCSSDLVRWERLYPTPIQAENLDFLDFIFCTHAHFDHADPWTLRKIAEVNHKAIFIGPPPCLQRLFRLRCSRETDSAARH